MGRGMVLEGVLPVLVPGQRGGAMAKLKPEFLKHKKHLDSILPDILRCPHVPGAEKARAVLFCAAPGLTYTLAHARGKLHGSKTD